MKKSVVLLSGVGAVALAYAANAETAGPSVQSILSTMSAAGGSVTLQWQIAPSYSELFGLGVRGAVGGYVNEDFALGVIIDYAEHREEYLANAGVQLNDSLRVIGTVGLLKESEEFTLGQGREDVRQLQYGLSLKGSYDAGIVRGYEINGYHTNASSDTGNVETGDLTGLQLMTHLQPSANSNLRLGAGYERAEWDGGDVDEGFTWQAVGSHKLSDVLSLNYNAKSAETENVFGLGLSYDLSTPDVQNSALSISFNKIEGNHGISDDTRVAVNWTVGLGAAAAGSSNTTMSSMGGMPSVSRKDLLADVMTRPAFLPERVLAKAGSAPEPCSFAAFQEDPTAFEIVEAGFWEPLAYLSQPNSLYINSNAAGAGIGVFDIYVSSEIPFPPYPVSPILLVSDITLSANRNDIDLGFEAPGAISFLWSFSEVAGSCNAILWAPAA